MLNPYRVLDLSDERGVLASQMWSDLSADVIQIEPPDGSSGRRIAPFFAHDPQRSIYWAAYTRGKRGITCNLDHPDGQDLLRRLAATADLIIESSDVGDMAARGLAYHDLADSHPNLIYTSISAFGQTGPKSSYLGSDLAIWAAGAPLLMTGDDDRAPVRVSQPQAWHHAAADAAGGAMLALWARRHRGRGQHVDVAAQISAAQATLGQILAFQLGAGEPERFAGGVKIRGVGLRGSEPVQDGHIVLTLAPGPAIGHFANHAAQWLVDDGAADPSLLDEDFVTFNERALAGQADPAVFEALQQAVQRRAAAKTKQEMLDISIQYDLLLVPVLTITDLVQSRQLASRNFWRELPDPDGRHLRYPGPPLKVFLDGDPMPANDRPPPRLGQHNREIYGELGLSAAEIDQLAAEGVI